MMSAIGKHNPSDAAPNEGRVSGRGRPAPTHVTAAEQARESSESDQARNAGASNREHMVDIGRGNQQAGRQGQ
jgi:hypothetical protein